MLGGQKQNNKAYGLPHHPCQGVLHQGDARENVNITVAQSQSVDIDEQCTRAFVTQKTPICVLTVRHLSRFYSVEKDFFFPPLALA